MAELTEEAKKEIEAYLAKRGSFSPPPSNATVAFVQRIPTNIIGIGVLLLVLAVVGLGAWIVLTDRVGPLISGEPGEPADQEPDLDALARQLVENHADALRGPQGEQGPPGPSVAGMVVAFNGTASKPCPTGWGLFEDDDGNSVAGRFIVGAGQGPGLTARGVQDTGGEEDVTLSEAQMPRHRHEFVRGFAVNDGGSGMERIRSGDDQASGRYSETYQTDWAGEDRAHENMPPFIALYWCTPQEAG